MEEVLKSTDSLLFRGGSRGSQDWSGHGWKSDENKWRHGGSKQRCGRNGQKIVGASTGIDVVKAGVSKDIVGVSAGIDIVEASAGVDVEGADKVMVGMGVVSLEIRKKSWLMQIFLIKLRWTLAL